MTGAAKACPLCGDSGYQPDRTWCTCPARPFASNLEAKPVDPQPTDTCRVITRAEHARDLITHEAIRADAACATADLMEWSRLVIGPVIALGQLTAYAEHGSFDIVAGGVLAELAALEDRLAAGRDIINRARAAALDALGEGAPA